jgi:hypothetical protein
VFLAFCRLLVRSSARLFLCRLSRHRTELTRVAATITGLAQELTVGRQLLVDTQASLGVRAGCQLWERFFALSAGSEDFPAYKRSLIVQGRSFCSVTAPQCRQKIAELAVGFLRDDCTVRPYHTNGMFGALTECRSSRIATRGR